MKRAAPPGDGRGDDLGRGVDVVEDHRRHGEQRRRVVAAQQRAAGALPTLQGSESDR
jgi:hypothetical protein